MFVKYSSKLTAAQSKQIIESLFLSQFLAMDQGDDASMKDGATCHMSATCRRHATELAILGKHACFADILRYLIRDDTLATHIIVSCARL